MSRDQAREDALLAVHEFMAQNQTNSVGAPYVWRAVNEALDAFDEELARDDGRYGWLVMDGPIPIAGFATLRMAKWHRRMLRTREGVRGLTITSVPLHF